MSEYGRKRKAESEDIVVSEKSSSQSVLVKCIVFGNLNDEQGAERQRSRGFRNTICFMSSGDPTGYGSDRWIWRKRRLGDEGWTGGRVGGDRKEVAGVYIRMSKLKQTNENLPVKS